MYKIYFLSRTSDKFRKKPWISLAVRVTHDLSGQEMIKNNSKFPTKNFGNEESEFSVVHFMRAASVNKHKKPYKNFPLQIIH